MPDDNRARSAFDALCTLLDCCTDNQQGTRLKAAAKGVGEVVGEEGREALRRGDVVGALLEAMRNARRRRR